MSDTWDTSATDRPTLEQKTPEELQEEKPDEKSYRNTCLIILVINLLIIVSLYLIFGKKFFNWLYTEMSEMVRSGSFGSILILLALQLPFHIILFLPGLAYLNIMMAIMMKNAFKAWMIAFWGGYISSLIVYAVVRRFFFERIKRRFRHFEPYQMLLEETKEHPIRDGILFNCIFIPASVKCYVIAITNLEFWQAAIAFMPGPLMLNLLAAMIGSEIGDISELFVSHSWEKKSQWQKIQFFFTLLLTVLTIGLVVYIAIYYRRKYTEYQLRRASRMQPNMMSDIL